MSLSYDTARKLKGAGFPQKTPLELVGQYSGGFMFQGVYHPSLEELLGACPLQHGKGYLTLIWCGDWVAGYEKYGDWMEDLYYHAITPIEAVAALYLALNEKN